jgi:hypothetical protein
MIKLLIISILSITLYWERGSLIRSKILELLPLPTFAINLTPQTGILTVI